VLAALAVSESSAALRQWGAPQTTHDIWEIWAAGASHAGGSSSPGHSAAAVQRGYWVPPIHNIELLIGLCSRPGEDPNAWKQFEPEPTRAIEPRHRPPRQRWILDGGLRGGVRVGRPFGARRRSPVRGSAR
jgi:hypothetical protein